MTVVRRLEKPFCTGCVGFEGWGACFYTRPQRHRHGDLPAETKCSLWTCQGCGKPSKMVYAKRLAAVPQTPVARERAKPRSRRAS